jgi:hypothetical protein
VSADFETWWTNYLSGREINPFPDKAALWNAKQAAWSAWHAVILIEMQVAKESAAMITSRLYYSQKDGCKHDHIPCGKICYNCVEEELETILANQSAAVPAPIAAPSVNEEMREALRHVLNHLDDANVNLDQGEIRAVLAKADQAPQETADAERP